MKLFKKNLFTIAMAIIWLAICGLLICDTSDVAHRTLSEQRQIYTDYQIFFMIQFPINLITYPVALYGSRIICYLGLTSSRAAIGQHILFWILALIVGEFIYPVFIGVVSNLLVRVRKK